MNDIVVNFIRGKRIDSFQKLYFLLYLFQHPRLTGTYRDLARQLYLGDELLVCNITVDLQKVGLLAIDPGGLCALINEPEILMSLEYLAKAFEAPVTRLKILDQVSRQARLY